MLPVLLQGEAGGAARGAAQDARVALLTGKGSGIVGVRGYAFSCLVEH